VKWNRARLLRQNHPTSVAMCGSFQPLSVNTCHIVCRYSVLRSTSMPTSSMAPQTAHKTTI
jgi:hypothetical protein